MRIESSLPAADPSTATVENPGQPVAPAAQEHLVEAAAHYFSPVVRFDSNVHAVVLQHRDTTTGETLAQFPSEEQVRAYAPAETKHGASLASSV